MPAIETAELGLVEFAETDVYTFPAGLPAFEHLRRFLLIQQSHLMPLAFLVSTEQAGLRFICVRVEVLVRDYEIAIGKEDLAVLGLESGSARILLAILSFQEGKPPTANLVAPVVLNAGKGLGLQVVQADSQYCVEQPLYQGAG